MKKLLLAALSMLVATSVFAGCKSKEVRTVISEIDSLGEITLESEDKIRSIAEKYKALSEEEKQEVSNFDVLQTAEEKYQAIELENRMLGAIADDSTIDFDAMKDLSTEYDLLISDDQKVYFKENTYNDFRKKYDIMYLDHRIGEECVDVTSDSFGTLIELNEEYEALDEDRKAQITNSALLAESLDASHTKKVNSIINNANGYLDYAWEQYNTYREYFTQEEIEKCLISIGQWEAFKAADKKLKSVMKNPSSYQRHSGSVSEPTIGFSSVDVKINYSGMNSFGGVTRDTEYLEVFLTIDPSAESPIKISGVFID